jgi:ubiquinone/menaquinone biosynthesis C-methylase UbiE
MTANQSDPSGHHDWESSDYVDRWIASDVLRDDERRVVLRRILDRLAIERDRPIRVLDVGAGYGVLTRELLESFPRSTVVLVDLSQRMLEHARSRLAEYSVRFQIVEADLRDARWTRGVDGPFQIVASAMAVHNVRHPGVIRQIYTDMASLITPGGLFVNIDLVAPSRPDNAGAGEVFDLFSQMRYLGDIGLRSVDCVYREGSVAAVVAAK